MSAMVPDFARFRLSEKAMPTAENSRSTEADVAGQVLSRCLLLFAGLNVSLLLFTGINVNLLLFKSLLF